MAASDEYRQAAADRRTSGLAMRALLRQAADQLDRAETGVRTWADGFGIWHAEVTNELTQDADVAEGIARGAILTRLAERESRLSASRVGVQRAPLLRPTALHFRECDPENEPTRST